VPKTHRQLTVRLSEVQVAELEAVATADGVAVVEEIRTAVRHLIDAKRLDPEFQARLRDSLERNRDLLSRLTSR
jgi:signal transduction protein with GAF and PtsI domain